MKTYFASFKVKGCGKLFWAETQANSEKEAQEKLQERYAKNGYRIYGGCFLKK